MKKRIDWIDTAKGIGILLVVGRILVKPLLGATPWLYVLVLIVVSIGISLAAYELVIKKVRLFRYLLLGET